MRDEAIYFIISILFAFAVTIPAFFYLNGTRSDSENKTNNKTKVAIIKFYRNFIVMLHSCFQIAYVSSLTYFSIVYGDIVVRFFFQDASNVVSAFFVFLFVVAFIYIGISILQTFFYILTPFMPYYNSDIKIWSDTTSVTTKSCTQSSGMSSGRTSKLELKKLEDEEKLSWVTGYSRLLSIYTERNIEDFLYDLHLFTAHSDGKLKYLEIPVEQKELATVYRISTINILATTLYHSLEGRKSMEDFELIESFHVAIIFFFDEEKNEFVTPENARTFINELENRDLVYVRKLALSRLIFDIDTEKKHSNLIKLLYKIADQANFYRDSNIHKN